MTARDPESGYHAVFDDDGRVAYAYLCDPAKKIIADVWLYNVAPTPEVPDWTSARRGEPPLNPRAFVSAERFRRPAESDVHFEWKHTPGVLVELEVHVRGERFARLVPGEKPGRSRLAGKESPVARPLDAP